MILFALAAASILRLAPESPDTKLRQPQLAAQGSFVAMTYGSGNDIWFAPSRDAGRTFSAAVKVGTAGALALGMHRGPRIAVTGKTVLISAVAGEKGRGADGDVVLWRSTDEGRTWSTFRRLNSVAGAAREGLHAMAARDNTLFLSWLDLRSPGTKLYGKVSRDRGATWSDDFEVYTSPDGHICECCHPSVAIGPNGELHAMWRNWLRGSRDLWMASSQDGGKTWKPVKSGEGTWPLKACPMDGGGIAIDAKGRVTASWRREKTVYLVESGKPEESLGAGKDSTLALYKERPYVAWVNDGKILVKTPRRQAEVAGEGSTPVLAAGDAVILAWEENGAIRVARVQE